MVTRSAREGELSREALLNAAEELFAEHGIDGVSIRSINKAAGLAPAALHYHFGSKDAVLRAVLLRHGETVLMRTMQLADSQPRSKGKVTAKAVINVIATAYTELLGRDLESGTRWLRIIGQLSLTHEPVLEEVSRDATARLLEMLHQAYPQAPQSVLAESLTLAVSTFIQLIGQIPKEHSDPEVLRQDIDLLVEFVAGGLSASVRAGSKSASPPGTGDSN